MILIEDADLNLPATQGIRITSDSNIILSPIIKNYLTRDENGFQLDANTNSYVLMGRIDAIFLEKISNFLP